MTHAANRLRPRKAQRAVPATADDMARWARLVLVAGRAGETPEMDPKPVAKARNAVRNRSMPAGQAVRGSAFDQLCRLTLRWPSMITPARQAEARELGRLAALCGEILDGLAGDASEPRIRADVGG